MILPEEASLRLALAAADHQREEERRNLIARVALGVKMLTTAGYAMVGGTLFKSIADHHEVGLIAYLWTAAGLGALAAALYFAPWGAETHD